MAIFLKDFHRQVYSEITQGTLSRTQLTYTHALIGEKSYT